jgi:hypothetical protein
MNLWFTIQKTERLSPFTAKLRIVGGDYLLKPFKTSSAFNSMSEFISPILSIALTTKLAFHVQMKL